MIVRFAVFRAIVDVRHDTEFQIWIFVQDLARLVVIRTQVLRHERRVLEHLFERMPDFRIAQHARVARTFQNIRLFGGMTVLENLLIAQHHRLMLASGMTCVTAG